MSYFQDFRVGCRNLQCFATFSTRLELKPLSLHPRAKRLYAKLYCARGEMENRIKEQQLGLFADRTSTATMRANQLRLYFSSFA